MSEVTHDMILSKYNVQLKKELTTGWVKVITLTDATGVEYELHLHWDIDKGYWIANHPQWDTIVSTNKLPEMDMPEFEYVLDSIIEDMKYDRDNPWNYVDFGSQP